MCVGMVGQGACTNLPHIGLNDKQITNDHYGVVLSMLTVDLI